MYKSITSFLIIHNHILLNSLDNTKFLSYSNVRSDPPEAYRSRWEGVGGSLLYVVQVSYARVQCFQKTKKFVYNCYRIFPQFCPYKLVKTINHGESCFFINKILGHSRVKYEHYSINLGQSIDYRSLTFGVPYWSKFSWSPWVLAGFIICGPTPHSLTGWGNET